jgi:triphosphoribosyl-dephospho-CoA synthetase
MRVSACCTAASLLEVCVSPSPGLVNLRDSGAHTDMNFLTFMLGTSVLSPYYLSFAEFGHSNPGISPRKLFDELRKIGVQAEIRLLEATSGVNTQRGQLFLMGLAAGIAGLCLARNQDVPSQEFYSTVREACAGLCERELGRAGSGVKPAAELGLCLAGARGEAEAGFPTVETVGYPALLSGLQRGLSLNDASVHALINIMGVLVDTTVNRRLGVDGISTMHETAKRILAAGSVFTRDGRNLIREAHSDFCRSRLSPGGAADLLALSMALCFIERGFPGPGVILAPSLFERDK